MGEREWTVGAADAGVRLDKFLASADRLASRGRASAALERGKVFVNGTEASRHDAARRLAARDVVRFWEDRPGSARPRPRVAGGDDLQIVYEDASLLVINKPAGLLTVPLAQRPDAVSVYDLVAFRLRSTKRRPFVVHRIDRDTSGLVVVAKDPHTQQQLKTQFKQQEPERVYWAVVEGHPSPRSGVWRDRLAWDRSDLLQKPAHPRDARSKEAVCEYSVVETFARSALIEVRLKTGKRNQIRIQARLHGHPIVGERLYAGKAGSPAIAFARQALHARRLSFRHPADGRLLTFEAPLPADLTQLLERLRRTGAQ